MRHILLLLLLLTLAAHAQRLLVPASPALEATMDGRAIKLRLESNSSQWDNTAGWPKPDQRGVLPIDGPGGPALRFATGYAIYDGINPVGAGMAWTVAFWLRPDEPDWGIWQVPWNSQRDPKTMYRFVEPVVMHFGTFLTHLWEVRLCRNRLKLVVGDWTAAGSTPLPVGAWTHVVLVRDGDSLRVYLNGVPETLTPPERVDGATGALLPPATDPLPPFSSAKVTFHPSDGAKTNGRFPVLVLGASHDNHQYQAKFIGAVGPLVMENRPWSAAEVAAACNAAAPEGRRLSLRWSVLDDPVGGYSRRPDKVQETSAEYLVRTAWFRKARYGLFMHWNPSSLTKAEISWGRGSEVPADVYDNLYKQFNPTLYRPAQWAADLQAGGMGYAVLTVKHHDGFLMWPSATSTYTIAATPYGKDIAGQYIAAMRAAKVPVGLYYSPRDWWWKADRPEIVGPPETRASIIPYVTAHMRELCGQYGPIDLFWFDGGVGGEAEIYQTVIGPRQPQCLTNDRNGPGDYLTPEGQIPSRPLINPDGSDAVWESCIPMGNGGWSYHHDGAEPYDVLIRQMVEIFAKGGNLLRDIGPRPTGEWSPPVVARIHEIGAWLRTNGRSVYGTHRTRLGAQSWGWTTADRDTLYLHVFHWPGATLVLDNLPDRARSARLLATGKRLRWAQQDHRLTITLPNTAPDLVDTVIAVGIRRR